MSTADLPTDSDISGDTIYSQCEKCGDGCAECDDKWGFCTKCELPDFCMHKLTCTCPEGEELDEEGKNCEPMDMRAPDPTKEDDEDDSDIDG